MDGTTLATPRPEGAAPGVVRLETYRIPPGARRDAASLTVTFQANDAWDAATANVFGCAVRRAP